MKLFKGKNFLVIKKGNTFTVEKRKDWKEVSSGTNEDYACRLARQLQKSYDSGNESTPMGFFL